MSATTTNYVSDISYNFCFVLCKYRHKFLSLYSLAQLFKKFYIFFSASRCIKTEAAQRKSGSLDISQKISEISYFVWNFKPSSLFHSPRVKSGTATGILLCLADVADNSPMQDHSAAS